jgi:hypothetical protein
MSMLLEEKAWYQGIALAIPKVFEFVQRENQFSRQSGGTECQDPAPEG